MELTHRIQQRLRETADWSALIDELEAEAAGLPDAVKQSNAFFELATACEGLFLDQARAMQCYQRAFKLNQDNVAALQGARQIFERMAHLDMVTKLMGLELKKNQDPARSPGLNYAYGRTLLNLNQPDGAREFLEAASAASPDDAEYRARVDEIAYDRATWSVALEAIVAEIASVVGSDDVLAASCTGREAAFRRGGRERCRGVSALYLRAARVLKLESPEDERILPFLLRAVEADPLNDEASFLAETLLAGAGQLEPLRKLHERRLELVEDPQLRAELAKQLGLLWQVRLNQPGTAARFYRQALDQLYSNVRSAEATAAASWHLAAFRQVVQHADETGGADGLVSLAERGLASAGSGIQAALLALSAGELAWRQFGDVDTARRFLRLAAAEAPDHPVVRQFTREAGPFEPASESAPAGGSAAVVEPTPASPALTPASAVPAATAQAEAVATSPVAPVSTGDEAFSAAEQQLIDQAEQSVRAGKPAIDVWREVVAKLPEKRYPRSVLKRLYIESKKWSSVADLLKEELKRQDDAEVVAKTATSWELIEVYRDQLKQPGLVVTTLAALEKLLETAGLTEELLRVVEAQQAQFEEMKRWPDLISRIRRRAELSSDPASKTELHLQAGRLFLEKFNNQAEAIKSFEAVLEADARNVEALTTLKDLYGKRRDWEKMLLVQQKELALVEDLGERMERLLEVARTADAKIKRPALSIELWSQVLEIDPGHLEALEHLEQMQEREKRWPELASTLEALVQHAADAEQRSGHLVKLGLLYSEKLDDPNAAISAWARLLELDPENRRAQDALKKLYLAAGDIDSLEGLYAKQDKWGEFVRVLERETEGTDAAPKPALLLRIAGIYRDKLDKPDRAIRALEKLLSDDASHLEAAQSLVALYESTRDERNLGVPLQVILAHTEDPVERQILLARLADLAERVQRNAAAAFGFWKTAFAEDHTSTPVLAHLERLGDEIGCYEELVEIAEQGVAKFGASAQGLPLRLLVARIYETRLGRLDAALAANQAVLEIDPEESVALLALERLYVALGRETDLLEVLTTKLALAKDEGERRATQARIASLHEQLGHDDAAIEAYRAVLATGVEDVGVLRALDRIFDRLGRVIELAEVLRRELAVVPSDDTRERTALTLRLAFLEKDKLSRDEEAVELFRQVLELAPEHEAARVALEHYLDREDLKLTVSQILLPIYEAQEAWEPLVRCLEIQAESSAGSERIELLLRRGAILAQALGDTERAFQVYATAFGEDPENENAIEALESLAGIDEKWGPFAALFEEAVTKPLPRASTQALLARLAVLYDTKLGQPEKAVLAYQRAVDLDPDNVAALEALERLYERSGNWAELLEVYRRKVLLTAEVEERTSLRFRIARLQEERLGQPKEAISTYNEVLGDDDTDMQAIAALDRLYEGQGAWIELADNLLRQRALTDDPNEQIRLNLRLGELQLSKLEQPSAGVETFHRVLDIDPTNEAALGALERLLEDPAQQLAVAKILEPVYRATNDWPKLIRTYEIVVAHSLDPREKMRLLHQIGELYEIGGEEPARAFAAFGRALREDPADEAAQSRLENLARQMDAYGDLAALYEEVSATAVDDGLRASLLAKVAQIQEVALQDAGKAAATYAKMLSLDPGNFEAIDALIEVHRRTQDFDALVAAVVRKSEMVDSPDERRQLLMYAANVRENVMDNPEAAVGLYRQVLTIDDGDMEALEALEKLYITLERWEELKDVYQRKTELTEDPEERRKVLFVLGQVYDTELKNVDRAIDTYQAILDIDPLDAEAIAALDRLYGQAGRWLDQLQILERAVDGADHVEEQTSIRHRMGALWETHLGDMARAVESYREVLVHDPSHEETIAALDRIAHGDTDAMLAASVLEPLYEKLAEWDRLVDLYEVMIAQTEDPAARLQRVHHVARIYERQLTDFDKAFDAYARALELDPQDPDTLEQLERLSDVTGDWTKLAALLGQRASAALDPRVKVDLLLRHAAICEDKLSDTDGAVARYLAALEVDADNVDAVEALDRIFAHLERWPELVENLRRRIRGTDVETEVIELYFRMGQIQQEKLGDAEQALAAYREILNIQPNHQGAIEALEAMFEAETLQSEVAAILEPIYYASERWEALVTLAEAKLGGTPEIADRLQIVQAVAEICEHRLSDPGQAFIWWLRAYMDDPTSEQVNEEIDRLAALTGEWEYVIEAGNQVLDAEVPPEVRLAVLMRSAATLDEKMADPDQAMALYRRALDLDPEHAPALAALDRLYTQSGAAQDLAEVLRRRIRITAEPDTLVDLELRLAETLEHALGSVEQAILAYNRALEQDPRNAGALARLEALFFAQMRWEDLCATYQRMADVANTDEEMAACFERMAKISSDVLERESTAIDLWNRVLDLRGEDARALGELAKLHQKAERWDDLIEILERQVYVLEAPEEKVGAYKTLGQVYAERLNNERRAQDAWLSALEIDPYEVVALEALANIYRRNEAYVELVDVLGRLIAVGEDILGRERLRDLHAEVGRIQRDRLLQPDQAILAWQAVLAIDPSDAEVLAALDDLYRSEARWSDVIDLLERRARLAEDLATRVDLLIQVAGVWEEKLGDVAQATGAYLEVLEVEPSNLAASLALENIYRAAGEWGALTELLMNRAELAEDLSQKVAALQAAAAVSEEQGDLDMAFELFKAAFSMDYANDLTSREIERLATQADKWSDLLEEYNGIVEQIEEPAARADLLVKIGRWYGEHLDQIDQGVAALKRALELSPDNVAALRELASFHRRSENALELADTLARLALLEQDPTSQVEVLLDLARAQEQSLHQTSAAIESYRRVLEIDSSSVEALDALGRLHDQRGDHSELVAVLSRRLEVGMDATEALGLRKKIGQVQETALGDLDAAVETYRDVLAQEPSDLEALYALERLYLARQQVDPYLEILEAQIDATVDADLQIAAYDKIATALIEQAHDQERAADVLEKILVLDPQRFEAYSRLEQLYTAMERWSELVATYRNHVDTVADAASKVTLLSRMGEVYERKVEDLDRAVETYREILAIDDANFEAARTLARLQEAVDDWGGAIDTIGRLVELTADPAARLDLLSTMGRVLHQRLGDPVRAEMRLNEALAIDPAHVPALVLLSEIYRERGDWLKAARALQRGSESSRNPLEKTNLSADAAFIYLEELQDREEATRLLRRTLELDPEHVRAGKVLAELCFEAGDYVGADPIYDVLTRKMATLDVPEDAQRDIYLHAAKTALALEEPDKALRHFQAAYEIDSTDHDVLVGMADLLFAREDWERAFKLYQTILVQHRDTQSSEDTVRVYFRLGTIKTRQGEPRKALNYLEKALEVDPGHKETLQAIISLQGSSNDWEGVIAAKRALLGGTIDASEQFALYKDIGSMYAEKIGNKDKAAEAYERALELSPGDYPVLHTLLDLYTAGKRHEEAVRTIDRIVELESDGLRRSRYNYTAAVILRDFVQADDEAIDRFNLVLDDDPTMLKAFQAIDSMVTKKKDWKTLERAYRKMLHRLPQEGHDDLKLALWGNLGEIYRTRMNDYRAAAAALEIASKLQPDDMGRHIMLAELYERLIEEDPEQYGEAAVRQHQILIAVEPFRYDSYHALFGVYRRTEQVDKAYCVATVLTFLKKATDEEAAFAAQYQRAEYKMARQRLSETTLRKHVVHPDEDPYLTAILGLIAPSLAAWRAKDRPPTIKPKERIDIATDPSLFSRMAKYIKDALNLIQPDVYIRPDEPGDVSLMNLKLEGVVHPSMVVFQNLLRGKGEKHLAFALARYMFDLYPPHYAYVALDRSPQSLKQVFMACLRIVGMPVQGATAELDSIAQHILAGLPAGAADQLRVLVKKFVEAGGSTDVKKWASAAELTNYRVGLLISGDLVAAAQMVSHEQSVLGSAMTPRDKIKELVLYSISEDYFTARRSMGLAVG